MTLYKLTYNLNEVLRSDGTVVVKGSRFWREYMKWLDEGNTPDLAEIDDEIKTRKMTETESLADQRITAILPRANRIAKLVRKEAKGNASQGDKDKLDAVDAIQDAEDLIKDAIEKDSGYDHINSPLWP